MQVIGWLGARSPAEAAPVLAAFRQGLGQTSYFEGKNVTIDYRGLRVGMTACQEWPRTRSASRYLIAATGGEPSGLAAKAATGTIPSVCTLGGDAVEAGLVVHLNQPGGNVTGVTIIGVEIGPAGGACP